LGATLAPFDCSRVDVTAAAPRLSRKHAGAYYTSDSVVEALVSWTVRSAPDLVSKTRRLEWAETSPGFTVPELDFVARTAHVARS